MRHRTKVGPGFTLIFCDIVEQQHPALNVDLDQTGLPPGFGYLRPPDFERAALVDIAQNP